MRSHRRIWMALLPLLLVGCAHTTTVQENVAYRTARGGSWVLVVEAPREGDLLAPNREVGRLVAKELGLRWFNVLDRDFVLQSSPELAGPLGSAVRQLLAGRQLDPELTESLTRRYGVGQLLIVDVFRHEQYWGRETRITRIGVEARLVHLELGRTIWQGRTDPEVSGVPGSGYDLAARQAAAELARHLSDEWPQLKDTPAANWLLLEYFATN